MADPFSCTILLAGTQIVVHGFKSRMLANYTVDGALTSQRPPLSLLGQPSKAENLILFQSDELSLGKHTLIIDGMNVTEHRNYTLSQFVIFGVPQSDKGKRIGMTVGIVLGALILVLGSCWGVWWYLRRRRRQKQDRAKKLLPLKTELKRARTQSMGSLHGTSRILAFQIIGQRS